MLKQATTSQLDGDQFPNDQNTICSFLNQNPRIDLKGQSTENALVTHLFPNGKLQPGSLIASTHSFQRLSIPGTPFFSALIHSLVSKRHVHHNQLLSTEPNYSEKSPRWYESRTNSLTAALQLDSNQISGSRLGSPGPGQSKEMLFGLFSH